MFELGFDVWKYRQFLLSLVEIQLFETMETHHIILNTNITVSVWVRYYAMSTTDFYADSDYVGKGYQPLAEFLVTGLISFDSGHSVILTLHLELVSPPVSEQLRTSFFLFRAWTLPFKTQRENHGKWENRKNVEIYNSLC